MAEGTEPSDLVRFAEKLIGLLDQGSFVSTYKYAVLLGLMDLCLEQGGRDGAPPAMVTTRQLARKVIGLYWPHTRPFQVPGHPARVLKQNPDRQARIVSLVAEYRASRAADPSTVLHALPDAVSTPELQIKLEEGENYALIAQLQATAQFTNSCEINKIDGLRVEYADGFGLARSSNTTPVIVLRFEADNAAALERIKEDFRRVLLAARPDAKLPF